MTKEKIGKKIKLGIVLLIVFTGLAGHYKLSQNFIDIVQTWIVLSLIIGSITSFFAAKYSEIINDLTNGFLKEEYLYIKNFFGLDFSISVFAIVTLFIEFALFRF